MDEVATCKMINDFTKIKQRTGADNEADIAYIIKTMSAYSKKDLYLFRDCIDLVLIYNK